MHDCCIFVFTSCLSLVNPGELQLLKLVIKSSIAPSRANVKLEWFPRRVRRRHHHQHHKLNQKHITTPPAGSAIAHSSINFDSSAPQLKPPTPALPQWPANANAPPQPSPPSPTQATHRPANATPHTAPRLSPAHSMPPPEPTSTWST